MRRRRRGALRSKCFRLHSISISPDDLRTRVCPFIVPCQESERKHRIDGHLNVTNHFLMSNFCQARRDLLARSPLDLFLSLLYWRLNAYISMKTDGPIKLRGKQKIILYFVFLFACFSSNPLNREKSIDLPFPCLLVSARAVIYSEAQEQNNEIAVKLRASSAYYVERNHPKRL